MKFLSLIILSFLIISIESARIQRKRTLTNAKKENQNEITYDEEDSIVQSGFELGNEIMVALDNYREQEVQMKVDIQRTNRMKELAYELVILIRDDIDKFDSHPEFLKRAKRYTADCYYAEFVAKIFDKSQFPDAIIKAWAEKSENSKRDLQWEYDEGAAYCIKYSTGYLCATTLLMLPDEANPEKTALIQKLREL